MYATLAVKIADYETIYAREVRIEDGHLIVVEGDETHTVALADVPSVRITAD